jgi:hypothetical protein
MPVQERTVWDESFIAAADLRTKKYYAAKISAANTVDLAGAVGDTFGGVIVVENDIAKGVVCRLIGLSKAISGAAVTLGAYITVDGAGKFIDQAAAATVNNTIWGIALSATDGADEIFQLMVLPMLITGAGS